MRSVDHSVPETPLTLQVGDRHILASSPDRRAGLAKNRIVTVVELRHHSVVVRLDGANNASTLHTLARARFVFCVGQNKAVKLCRIQLPLMHAWALTVNKSQVNTRVELAACPRGQCRSLSRPVRCSPGHDV
jgi:hypothetical protein